MRLPRRPVPLSPDAELLTPTTPTATSTSTPTSTPDERGTVVHRAFGVGLMALGAAGVVGLLGPVAPLAEGSNSPIEAAADATASATASPSTGATATMDVDEAAVVDDDDADETLAIRFTTRIEQRETVIPAPEEQRDNNTLPAGATRIDQVGVDGIRQETVEVTHRNGDVVEQQVIEVVEIAPTPTITSIGTATSAAATKNWAALAQCESSGNPTVVSSSGRYHGLYQFDVPTWKSVGGTGLPSQASPDEQTRRAMALYDQRGASPWPTCGRHL